MGKKQAVTVLKILCRSRKGSPRKQTKVLPELGTSREWCYFLKYVFLKNSGQPGPRGRVTNSSHFSLDLPNFNTESPTFGENWDSLSSHQMWALAFHLSLTPFSDKPEFPLSCKVGYLEKMIWKSPSSPDETIWKFVQATWHPDFLLELALNLGRTNLTTRGRTQRLRDQQVLPQTLLSYRFFCDI